MNNAAGRVMTCGDTLAVDEASKTADRREREAAAAAKSFIDRWR
jgi:hypothetical protein